MTFSPLQITAYALVFIVGSRDHFSLELGDAAMLTELPEGLKDEVLYSVSPLCNQIRTKLLSPCFPLHFMNQFFQVNLVLCSSVSN